MPKRLLVFDNTRADGDAFDFIVDLPNEFRLGLGDVSSIEIIRASIPKIDSEIAAVVQISGCETHTVSNNDNVDRSFLAFFDNSLLAPGDFKPVTDFFGQKSIFNPPRPLPKRIRVQVKTPGGVVVDSSMTSGEERVLLVLKLTEL